MSFLCCLISIATWAQPDTLTLSAAHRLLEARYPQLDNAALDQALYEVAIDRIDRSRLPDLHLRGDARVQSETTTIPAADVPLPFEIDLPLYSIKGYAEARYLIYDGGRTEARKAVKAAQLRSDLQATEVERYRLRERVDALFTNVQILRAQDGIFRLSLENLDARTALVRAGVEEGAVLPGELTQLEVRRVELIAQREDLRYRTSGLLASLSALLGIPVSTAVVLSVPASAVQETVPALNRPELRSFELQRAAVAASAAVGTAERKPTLSAFVQAGLGYPNPLNLFDNGLAPYALIGAQFNWQLTDWKRSELDAQTRLLQQRKIANAEATFRFNLNTQVDSYRQEVARIRAQLDADQRIAELQGQLLQQLAFQLDEGLVTATDYLTQLNDELRARQNLLVHEAELLKIQLDFYRERGW